MKILGSALLSAILLTGAANAAQIVDYTLAGHPGSLLLTAADSSVTASDISFGAFASEYHTIGVFPDGLGFNAASSATTEASAVTNQSYFQFTVTPNSGSAINLTSLTFDAEGGTEAAREFVRSSVDGYTADLQHPVSEPFPYVTNTIDLSASAYQNVTSAITFRIYGYVSGQQTQGILFYENLALNGSSSSTNAAAPEPSSISLMLTVSGLVAFVAFRRRRTRFDLPLLQPQK